MGGRITKVWARKTCERLVGLGILVVKEVRPRRKGSLTRHYRLSSTAEGFRALLQAYTATLSRSAGYQWPLLATRLLETEHVRRMLTPDFVRRILSERRVEIRYSVSRETSRSNRPLGNGSIGPRSPMSSAEPMALCFPIRRPGISFDDVKSSIHGFAEDRSLAPHELNAVAKKHYDVLEDRLMVFPILGLLQASPTAFLFFLGDWEPFESNSMSSSDQGLGMIEHVLFRLIFAAISDLALTRVVPEGLDVSSAQVRPEHSRAQRHEPALLELAWRGEEIIGYEAGFDTDHLMVGGEDTGPDQVVEVTRNPENCWVRIWWDSPPSIAWREKGLESRIGYRFADSDLLAKALTHSSASDSTAETKGFVEQAAWIGDAILQSVATEYAFQEQGSASVQDLHNRRSEITANAFLGEIAERLGLPAEIRIGKALENNLAATDRHQMHATHLEALIGATFLDGGLPAAQMLTRRLLNAPVSMQGRMDSAGPQTLDDTG